MTVTEQPMVPKGYELKKKKPIYKRVWFWLAVVLVAAIAGMTAGGGSGATDSADSGAAAGTVNVVYTLESDASSVSATYATLNNGSIGQEQQTAVAPPFVKELNVEDSWVKSFTLVGQMNPAALNGGQDGTSITCRITVDGEVVAEQTSNGQYAMVTCNAS